MKRQHNRRDFLKTTALAGAGFWVAGPSRADEREKSALEQVHFACIGVGGKGTSDTAEAARHGNIVAICDVDQQTLEQAAGKYPKAKKYADFRKMLDEMGKSIDAVTVSTPDHTHAVASALAMRMGKHCFTQKPLTRTIHEARRLGEIAREMKVATQMGNQGTASNELRKTAALLRAGVIGAVKEVHVWTNRPIWPQGSVKREEVPAPTHVDWDLWLGPAAKRPYAAYPSDFGDKKFAGRPAYHPFAWRGYWAFGSGALGDMGCHNINMAFMALDLRDPVSVEAETSGHNQDSFPSWSIVRYAFPAKNARPALTLTWYDGGKRPSAELLNGETPGLNGTLVVGTKAKLFLGRERDSQYKVLGDVSQPRVDFPESPGHFVELVRAIKGGEPAMSNFPDYAGPLTETVLLGNLAIWAGKKIEWDSKNIKATNAPEVEPLIRPEYRKGYTL
jgi:predicted dehydrogenase